MSRSKVGDSGLDMILGVMHRRKWAGLIAFVTMLSLTAPFSIFLPDIYRGASTVLVESEDPSSTFVKPSVSELETRLVTIQQELLSRARLSNLIETLHLYPQWKGKVSQDSIVERMRRDIHVDFTGTDQTRGRATTISIKITYIGLDPRSAAAVPNALASLYVAENSRMRALQAGQMAQFLKNQTDAAAQELRRREQSLDTFKKAHAGELPDQMSMNLITLEQLNGQLQANLQNQSKVRERLDRLSERSDGASGGDEIGKLQSQLRELQSKYTDQYPEVIQVKEQLRELELQRAKEPALKSSKAGPSDDSELAALQRQEQVLRSQIASFEERIHLVPQHEQEVEKLENDYKSSKDTYDSLRTRYDEAQLAESLEQTRKGESFRVLDAAITPTQPAAPNRMRLRFLALMVALVSGIVALFITEHLDTSFHTVGELRQFTTVPVLATIPYIKGQTEFMSRALRVAAVTGAVIFLCLFAAFAAVHIARGNTQLVWMLAGPQT